MSDGAEIAVGTGVWPCRVIVNRAPDRMNDHAFRRAYAIWQAVAAGEATEESLDAFFAHFPDDWTTVTGQTDTGGVHLHLENCPDRLARVLAVTDDGLLSAHSGSPLARSLAPIVEEVLTSGRPLHALHRRVDDPRSEHWQSLILPVPGARPAAARLFLIVGGMESELLEHLANTGEKAILVADRPSPDAPPVARFANRQIGRLLGLEPTEMQNRPLLALLPPDWWSGLEKAVTDAIDHHAAGERDFAAPGIGSGWLKAGVTGIPQGCVIEIDRLENDGHGAGRNLIDVLSSLPIPMTVVDLATAEVTFYNRAAEVKFGLPPVGMTAFVSTDFYADPRDRSRVVNLLRSQGYLDHHQVRMRDAKGRPFWALLMSRLIVQDGREVTVTAVLDIEARHVMESELRRLATTDQLTGVANRTAFMAAFDRELARVGRTGRPLCLAMIDLDHFKPVNDTFGHAVGDDVLRGLVARLRPHLRSMDIFGRLGGEEFAILLPECPLEGAVALAERLREALAGEPVLTPEDGDPITVTASFGITLYDGPRDSMQKMLKRSDLALYAAKEAGRNTVRTELAQEV